MHRGWLALTLKRSSLLVALLLLAGACATPIGVTQMDTQSVYPLADVRGVLSAAARRYSSSC
jgi:hypothetical protein